VGFSAFIWVTGLPIDTHSSSARLLKAKKSLRRIDTIWSLISLSKSRRMFYATLIMPRILQGCRLRTLTSRHMTYFPIDRDVLHTYDYEYVDYVYRWKRGRTAIGHMDKRLIPDNVRLRSRLHTDFLTLCCPTCMYQRGTLSTSTHYRRKHLESRGFNMRWEKRIIANNGADSKEE